MEVHTVPLDLSEFRVRNERIVRARDEARRNAERHGMDEAEADHDYRKKRAMALAKHKADGASWSAAEKLAEGDAAGEKWARDKAHVLRDSAKERLKELERNAAMLRAELDESRRLGLE